MAPHKYNAEEVIAAFKKPTQRKISEEPEGSKHLDINQVRRALTYLDPSNRKVWINVGHEMKSEGEILCELYLEWSRGDLTGTTPNSFVSDEEVYSKWEEFDPKRTSISFLFRAAEKNGYEPPHDSYLLERGTIVECAEHLLSKMFLKGEEHLTFQPCATLLMISGLRILIPCVNGMPKAKSDVTLITNLSFSKSSIRISVTIYGSSRMLTICRVNGVL